MFDPLLEGRGRLRIATGAVAEGVADLLACGERQERWGAHNPSVIPWRSMAAEAMIRLDRREEAVALADEEVELARRTGLPRALGMSLRVAGLVRGDQATLEAAVVTLTGAGSVTELARARLSLGAALRRAGSRSAAQEELRLALDEADRAGAGALASAAREELRASGARPRRARLTGREALTASELRVCAQAARGSSNREIAQALFITVKTVETHLSSAYAKLGIGSRSDLADALASDGERPPT
jgi:DNA-binding CsgD family transcriptional regulator